MVLGKLLSIYAPLVGWISLGVLCGRLLPPATPGWLGKFLFWVGVPIGIFGFLRGAEITWDLWLAPTIAWLAIALGLGLGRTWLWYRQPAWSPQTQTSFLLTTMVGNTGYIGFPVSLILVGPQYFAWAIFYDLLGSTPGAYGLGVAIAAHTQRNNTQWWQPLKPILINPAFWSFGLGLACRSVPFPAPLELGLKAIAWMMVSISLLLVGMRLSRLSSWQGVKPALLSLSIKMLLVPFGLGLGLWALGITGTVHRALLLQMAMPPAFATLVISEAYDLDPELAVTTIAIGCLNLLITLPLWLWLFSG